MKKNLIISFIILLSVFIAFGMSDARVKGKCKDCHSMHYSHEGQEVTYGDRQGPFPVLTKGGCVGCHGQEPNGIQNIISMGKAKVPQVLHNMKSADLAGGNYYYVADGFTPDYTKGHNVLDISIRQNPPMDVPPGFIQAVPITGGTGPSYWPSVQQLTCSGTWGCHGNRTVEDPYKSMHGAHHSDDSEIDGYTVGRSYRFLYGITGKEHEDWEYLATIDNHNGYKGNISHDTMDTISYLCGGCHAKFHPHPNLGGRAEVGQVYNSLWYRHPTDIAFDSVKGGFADSEYQGYITYSLEAPVAFTEPKGNEVIVDSTSIVMCLSCHRAHASPFPSMLRWDYSDHRAHASPFPGTLRQGHSEMDTRKVTSGKGCLTCHTKKGQ